MTLDALDVCFDLQHYFKLNWKKAATIRTVADLVELVIAQNPTANSASCPTADAFYALREKLHLEFHLPLSEIHPCTPTAALIAKRDPRIVWQRLAKTLAVPLPALDYPGWSAIIIVPSLIAAIVGPIFLGAAYAQTDAAKLALGLSGALISVAFLVLLEILLRPLLAKRIPSHLQTLAGLAYLIAVESKNAKVGPWSRAEIMAAVQLVLARNAGTNPREMRRNMPLDFC